MQLTVKNNRFIVFISIYLRSKSHIVIMDY